MDGSPDAVVRERRDLAREAASIAEAEVEADAGLLIPAAEANAWIDSLGTANPLPMPQAAKTRS